MPRFPWPPLVVAAALAAAWLLSPARLGDAATLALPGEAWTRGAGLALVALALAVEATAVRGLLARGTTFLPHREARALVTGGLHGFSRNPIYVAHVTLVLGCALALRSGAGACAAAATLVLLDRLAVRPEEAFLSARFGADYEAYRARVPRWLGLRRSA
ncbi:MAG: isoprenylcysteine carboxylmethyltransferase family protein [Planctomycetota bacterium]